MKKIVITLAMVSACALGTAYSSSAELRFPGLEEAWKIKDLQAVHEGQSVSRYNEIHRLFTNYSESAPLPEHLADNKAVKALVNYEIIPLEHINQENPPLFLNNLSLHLINYIFGHPIKSPQEAASMTNLFKTLGYKTVAIEQNNKSWWFDFIS